MTNSIVRVLLEIGKHAELQLCSRVPATRRALPARATGNRRGASALELDSEARPRSLQRVAVDGRGRAAIAGVPQSRVVAHYTGARSSTVRL